MCQIKRCQEIEEELSCKTKEGVMKCGKVLKKIYLTENKKKT